ncbi:DUF4174 domain-containing protein [Mucilaginibacter sp. RS28]|uniref:DUF4174 domain-containing protein n=1 Tax=Mucilaginibacter straminoryzae TaxID=2932774 RepID=A0A9X1X3W1_9SPHI|nr:DUF4174 domain-containing protein [Mucilaginibacter straminoryzae]MCJ8209665.1 DUF4174 domain-containing protein [Mucilaginibacter straminoryzae]
MFRYLLTAAIVAIINKPQPKRMLMVFSDQSSQHMLHLQQQILKHDEQGLNERDVEIRYYSPKNTSVYKSNHIRPGFTVVLIGKDGGEKLRSHQLVSTQKLFSLVDAMPMRKQEMNNRH